MPDIQIRDVPSEVIAALNQRAARHERSLEGELRYLLATIASEELPPLQPLQLKLSQASPPTTWRREEMYGEEDRLRVGRNPSFQDLDSPEEDIYSPEDGEPFFDQV